MNVGDLVRINGSLLHYRGWRENPLAFVSNVYHKKGSKKTMIEIVRTDGQCSTILAEDVEVISENRQQNT